MKTPVPIPSTVLLSATVGFADRLQHTPLSVTGAPPSLTFPPLAAVVVVIFDAEVVIKDGTVANEDHVGTELLNFNTWPFVPAGTRIHAVPFQ